MTTNKPLISLIIPVFNEAANLAWHHDQIVAFFEGKEYSKEIIYVNDGSHDNSLGIIAELAAKDPSVHYISFSRNFGKEAATTAGLRKATGDAAIMIDADGQHPIEVVDEFITRWREGSEVVVGVRKQNRQEGIVKRYGSRVFNQLLNAISHDNTVKGSTDFRLLDRRVIDEFNKLTEHNRITRGLIDWLGFRRTYVDFKSPARHSGKASYGFKKLLKLAIHAFVSQSTKPLQFTGLLGGLVTFLSALVGIFLLIEKYLLGDPWNLAVTGTAILALFITFLVGLVMISNWLLALYIESIHNETQNRPLYVIDKEA